MSEPLTDAWRLKHVEQGDQALNQIHEMLHLAVEGVQLSSAAISAITMYIGIAQAHYQAANVRAKPQTSVRIHGLS